jgi:Ca-activated chloride channel family protein
MKKLLMIGFMVVAGVSAYASAGEDGSEKKTMPGAMFARGRESKMKMFLPLKKTDVKLWVSAGVVRAEVSQEFTNNSSQPLEAIYIFPLPSRSTVTNMVLKVGDRVIRSIVKEKEEAKKVYEKAKKEGKKTALIVQERPNIFTTSVANFLPGETVEIKISYIEPIEFSNGSYSVNFPMVVGPRYIPFKIDISKNGDVDMSPAVTDSGKINPPLLHPSVDSGHRLTMNVEIEGIPIQEIRSNTHSIKIDEEQKNGKTKYNVALRGTETIPDSDFNLRLILKKSSQPLISHLSSLNDNTVYSMINIFPPLTKSKKQNTRKRIPREVIFLVDTSGSMLVESIGQAKAGLKKCMQMLHNDDYFTIIRFSDTFSSFSPELRKADKSTISAAEGYVDSLTADGGTEMQQALEYLLNLPARNPENMQLIVFLTDGDVGNEDSLIRLISNKLGKRRLFTFGIGSAPNEYLMRKMAEQGRGQSRFIHSHEDIGVVMSDFFKTLDSPVLTDIALQWVDVDGNEIKDIKVFPSPCPDVFNERPLQLFVTYPAGKVDKIRISGKSNGEARNFEYRLTGSSRSYPAIEKLFANSAINHLMYELIMHPESEKRIKKDILKIALKHQLVTRFTSRVAVEEKITKQPDGSLLTVKVPVKLPKGWRSSAFFDTATSDPLMLLLGSLAILGGLIILIIEYYKNRREIVGVHDLSCHSDLSSNKEI